MKIMDAINTNAVNTERIYGFLERQHFMKWIDFAIDKIERGTVEGELELQQKHLQQQGMTHGGVTATISDIVAGFAAYTVVDETQHVVTAELKISYLHPGMGQKLRAIGKVLKAGSKLVFCESEVYSIEKDHSLLIAKATATMAII